MKQETINHLITTIFDENTSKDVAADLIKLVVSSITPGSMLQLRMARRLLDFDLTRPAAAELLDSFITAVCKELDRTDRSDMQAICSTAGAPHIDEAAAENDIANMVCHVDFPYKAISQLYRDYEWRQYGELQITILNRPVRLSAQSSATCYVARQDYVLLALLVSLGYDTCAKKMLAGLSGAVNLFCSSQAAGSKHKASDVIRAILDEGLLDSSDTLVSDISTALNVTPGSAWYAVYKLDEPCALRGKKASREAKLDKYLPAAARLLGKKIQAETLGSKDEANVQVVTDLAQAIKKELALTGNEPVER